MPRTLSDEDVDAIARRVIEIQRTEAQATTVGTKGAMAMLGYKSGKGFWRAVRRIGIPYTRISKRHCLFRAVDIDAALQRRQVGSPRVLRRMS